MLDPAAALVAALPPLPFPPLHPKIESPSQAHATNRCPIAIFASLDRARCECRDIETIETEAE
jgi:hypothetical protein